MENLEQGFFRRNPLMGVALAFALGIACSYWTGTHWGWFAFLGIAFIGSIALKRRVAALATIFVALGSAAYVLGLPAPVDVDSLCREGRFFTGTIQRIDERPTSTSMIVDTPEFRCQLTTPQLFEAQVGDKIRFSASFKPVGTVAEVPDERTPDLYLTSQRIAAVGFVVPDSIRVTGRSDAPFYALRRFDHNWGQTLLSSRLNGATATFLCAVLTGDSTWLDPAVRERFSASGIAHVLALSGMHIGYIAVIISILLFPLTVSGCGRLRWMLTIAALWAYAVATGLSPSVVRAVVMATVYALGCVMQRDVYSFNSLGLAAIVVLIFWPLSLLSVGFQLSFMAVAGILLFANEFIGKVKIKSAALRWLATYCAVSAGAVIGSGPLCAFYFHQFPLLFLITNLGVSLLIPPLIFAGVLVSVFQACGIELSWLCGIADWLYGAITWIAERASAADWAAWRSLYFPAWLLLPIYLAIGALWAWIRTRRMAFGLAAGMLAVFVVGASTLTRPQFPHHEAYAVHNSYYTTILSRSGDKATFFTTARPEVFPHILENTQRRFADFFGRRNVKEIEVRHVRSSEPQRIGSKTVALVSDKRGADSIRVRPDVLVVCRGYKADPVALANRLRGWTSDSVASVKPLKVYLSTDLHPARRARYLNDFRSFNAAHPADSIHVATLTADARHGF